MAPHFGTCLPCVCLQFVAPEAAKRVIAEEVSKVVASPVISHIDIEEMQKKVHERSMLTGRSGRRSRASARQAAGQSVIASARYKPHMSGKQLSTARRTGQGARVPRQNMRGSTNRGRPKRNSLKLPRLDASGNAPPDAAPQQQSNGAPPSRGSDAVPMLRMPAREEHGQPQTDAGGDSLDDVAAKFEKEKWKHTSANAYGSFMPPEGLEILPQKPKRVGQEDRATVEWNLITEFELVRTVPDCLVAHLTTPGATKLTRVCGVCARKKRRPRTPRNTRGRRRKRSKPSPSCTSKPRKRHLPSSASGKQAWRTTAKKWCATRVRRWPEAMLVAVCA